MSRISALHLSLNQIVILIFTVLIAVAPVTVFFLSRNFRSNSAASEASLENLEPKTSPREVPKDSPLKDLLNNSKANPSADPDSIGADGGESPDSQAATSEEESTIPKIIGSSLKFKIKIEGRPTGSHAAKVFLGIASGSAKTKPTYLLSFSVDVPTSGEFKDLSLNGLDTNTQYTAYLKGPAQIATSSGFTLTPNETTLNPDGEPLNMLSGDLNEDNRIDALDLGIAQKAFGANSNSSSWNLLTDFNLDKVINSFDLNIIRKNLGQIGASGPWYSTPGLTPPPASGSAQTGGSGGPSPEGYWMWFPKL